MRKKTIHQDRYYADVIPGLEKNAWRDIEEKLIEVELLEREWGRIYFSYSGDPGNLLHLRCVDRIYIHIRTMTGVTRSRKSLGDIFRQVRSLDLLAYSMIHKNAHRSKGKKNLTFRVYSTMDSRHNFRRIDAQKSVESAIMRNYKWKMDIQNPTIEFRIDLKNEKAIFGLKLIDEHERTEKYKIAHLPASLKPTLAYCMCLMSEPSPMDVFVDPMCGAGTIPMERTYAGPYKTLIAGDVEEGIIHTARENIESSRRNIYLGVWDVNAIPLTANSVDKVVCNLPFGKKIGSHLQNEEMYPDFFREMNKILKSGGMMVLLTSEKQLILGVLGNYKNMNLRQINEINLLGTQAFIFVITVF
ncbi:methyltransferase domain-containing protein [Candidatus Poribacteria bacterium]|nr:methyltransferase domain-containing protein [Candidatus Poribacteria bacterium]